MKLRGRVFLLFTSLALCGVLASGFVAYVVSNRAITANTAAGLEGIGILREAEIGRWIEATRQSLVSLAQRPLVRDMLGTMLLEGLSDADLSELKSQIRTDHLEPALGARGGLLDLSLVHPLTGEVLVSTNQIMEGKFRENRGFYTQGRLGSFVGRAIYEIGLESVVMHASTPVRDSLGNLLGVLAGHLDLDELSRIVAYRGDAEIHSDTYLVNAFNFFVTDPAAQDGFALQEAIYTEGVGEALAGRSDVSVYKDYRGIEVLGAYRWNEEWDLAIITELPTSKAFAPLARLRWLVALIGMFVAGTVGFLGMIFSRRLARRMEEVERGVEEVARGNLGFRIRSTAKGSEGHLAASFDQMASRLQHVTASRDQLDQEVARRIATEEALRRSEGLFRKVFELLPVGLWIADKDGTLLSGNPAGIKIWGGSPLVAQEEYDVFKARRLPSGEEIAPDDWALAHSVNEGITISDELLEIDGFDGVTRVVVNYSAPVLGDDGEILAAIVVNQDVTERTRAEEAKTRLEARLQQQQRLESIGTLASGIAHEINNPLTGIINYADLIADESEIDRHREFAYEIMEEGRRVAAIVSNLLSFARQDQEPRNPACILDVIEGALSLIGSLLRKDRIAVSLEIPEDLPLVTCRSQQIRQVVVNLLTNARDALNERFPDYDEEKRLRIAVQTMRRTDADWIRITVEDSGVGIDPDVMNRIFDPFFTTKARDEGTGLGLAVSFGIIREHRGELSVESERGTGTRFHVDLRVTPC